MNGSLFKLIRNLRRSDVAVGLSVAVPLWLLLQSWDLGSLSAFMPGVAFAMVAIGRMRTMRDLEARVDVPADVPRWRVEVNGVDVGTLSDADYAAIHLSVLARRDVYLRQAQNLMWILMTALGQIVQSLPSLATFVLMAVAIVSPEALGDWLVAARQVTPQEFASNASHAICLLSLSAVALIGFGSIFTGATFGFTNHFSEAIGFQIRRRLGVAAVGEVVVRNDYSAEPQCDTPSRPQ